MAVTEGALCGNEGGYLADGAGKMRWWLRGGGSGWAIGGGWVFSRGAGFSTGGVGRCLEINSSVEEALNRQAAERVSVARLSSRPAIEGSWPGERPSPRRHIKESLIHRFVPKNLLATQPLHLVRKHQPLVRRAHEVVGLQGRAVAGGLVVGGRDPNGLRASCVGSDAAARR